MKLIETLLVHPLLRVALREAPEMTVEWVRNTAPGEDEWEMLFWARGGDFERFEAGLEADPTVTVTRSVDVGRQRLYQVEITDEGAETDLYPVLVDIGGLVMEATVTQDGWLCRFGFPDQAGVDRFFDRIGAYGIEYEVNRIYELTEADPEPEPDLTQTQRETLVRAIEAGYYDIPRAVSTSELADEFGVSDQAVSERLRRAIVALGESNFRDLDDRRPAR